MARLHFFPPQAHCSRRQRCGLRISRRNVEGVLHGEFFLGGHYMDDVLMARGLIAD
jgi:hypothetical protein